MKRTLHEELEVMELLPSEYAGTEFEFVTVSFKDATIYPCTYYIADALYMTRGSTVRIHGRIHPDKNDNKHIDTTFYLSDNIAKDFIDTYGHRYVNGRVTMKIQVIYGTAKYDPYDNDELELRGYKVLEIYQNNK